MAQLERILASRVLTQSESLVRLLRYVVTETLAGRSAHIKEYTLGVVVFERGADFDPKADTIVRAQARRLRRKLDEYYAGDGVRDELRLELPKGTYVPLFRRRPRPAAPPPPSRWRWALATAACIAACLAIGILVRPAASRVVRIDDHDFRGGTAWGAGEANQFGFWHPDGRPQAYGLYLRGRLGAKNARSLDYVRQATNVDPTFAPAWLAKAEILMAMQFNGEEAPARVLPVARDAALRAIKLGYKAAVGQQILAVSAGILNWNWNEAEKRLLLASSLDNDSIWPKLAYARILALRGRAAEAVDLLDRIQGFDEPAKAAVPLLASVYFLARQYDRAIEVCQAAIEAGGEAEDSHFWLGRTLLAKGLPERALPHLLKGRRSPGQGFGSIVAAYAAAGRMAEARKLLKEAEQRAATTYVSPVSLAQSYFAVGDINSGFRQLELAMAVRDQSLATLKAEPAYDAARADRRFQAILRRLNL